MAGDAYAARAVAYLEGGRMMHFSGRTWRPHYEADSCIIELTAGCAYGKCSFCNLYENEPFRMASLGQFEEDLQEIKDYQPHARRLFLTGANPFALSYERLKPYVLTVRDYLIKCQSIAMFASIRDIQNKEVWQLRKLRAMGVNGLSIGTESGDDDTLALAGKGYTADDILKQCRKLDEAGIEYYFVYMTGLAGKGGGTRNAVNSARLFSRLNPYFISVDALTLFPNTKLYDMAGTAVLSQQGRKRDCRSYRCSFRICRSGHICLPILPQIFIHYLFISQKKGKAPFQSCNM